MNAPPVDLLTGHYKEHPEMVKVHGRQLYCFFPSISSKILHSTA